MSKRIAHKGILFLVVLVLSVAGLFAFQTSHAYASGAPGVPVNVNNVNDFVTYNGTVIVTWYPSQSNGTIIDHYDVVEIHSNNTIGATVASVPASGSLSWKQTGLNLCTYYRYGVKAVTATGEESSVAFPLHQAFTSGSLPPGNEPKTVVVMAMGVKSQITGGTMHPLSRQSYCTTYDGINPVVTAPAPLQSLLDGWDNQDYRTHVIDATGPTGFGAGNRMIDSLVSTGAIVLPMSYSNGTRLTGPSAAPTFTTAGYKPDDVGNTSPDQVAQWLDDELVSIYKTWRNAKIIVVGHSAGGLATYLWWKQHGQYLPQGVIQAFSLDGPINGTQNSLCAHHVISWVCNKGFGIDSPLAQKVADDWHKQDQLDHEAQIIEQKRPIFTAVGTKGDAVWDFADGNRCIPIIFLILPQCVDVPGGDNNGLVSQVFHGDTCNQWFYTALAPGCAPAAHSIVSKCGPLHDGTHDNFYGLPGTEWTHSDVKNCPDVIAKIVPYAYHPTSKPTVNENPTQPPASVQRILTSQQTQSQTVNATRQGTTPGTQAKGTLSFRNPYQVGPRGVPVTYNAGTVFDDDTRRTPNVQMMIDATITVPRDGISVTVPAHVVQIGTIGNIPIRAWTSYDYNLPVDITNITPFIGGQDPQTYVKQSDIDTAANALQTSTRQSTVADLNSQLRPNEHLVGDPQCTYTVTSDRVAGDQATTVTVTVKAMCTATASTY